MAQEAAALIPPVDTEQVAREAAALVPPVDVDQVARSAAALVPTPKDGKDGAPGKDGRDAPVLKPRAYVFKVVRDTAGLIAEVVATPI